MSAVTPSPFRQAGDFIEKVQALKSGDNEVQQTALRVLVDEFENHTPQVQELVALNLQSVSIATLTSKPVRDFIAEIHNKANSETNARTPQNKAIINRNKAVQALFNKALPSAAATSAASATRQETRTTYTDANGTIQDLSSRPEYLKSKDSELYVCIGRKEVRDDKDVLKGYKYTFISKHLEDKEFTKKHYSGFLSKAQRAAFPFPAAEYTADKIRGLFDPFYNVLVGKQKINIPRECGFDIQQASNGDRAVITIPDKEALNYYVAKFNAKLIENGVKPMDFTLVSSKGIASDRDFVRIVLEGGTVYAEDKEFFHDATVHVLQGLFRAFADKTGDAKKDFLKFYQPKFDDIIKMEEKLKKGQSLPEGITQETLNFLMFYLAAHIDSGLGSTSYVNRESLSFLTDRGANEEWGTLILEKHPQFAGWTLEQVNAAFLAIQAENPTPP